LLTEHTSNEPDVHQQSHLGSSDVRLAVNASIARARADLRGLLAVVVSTLEVLANILDAGGLDALESGSVTVVGVDTGKELALVGGDIGEDDVALGLGLAVAAAAVELAEVVNSEAGNAHGAAAVVLEDLVLGAESTAAGDGGGLAGTLLLDGEGILADSRPPDVGQLAAAHAVDTLDLVGTDDDVGEGSAGLSCVSLLHFVGWFKCCCLPQG
jgi:hypothetical protein